MPMQVAVAASGRGSNLEALCQAFEGDADVRIALVVSNRGDAPALEQARARGIPAVALQAPDDAAEWLTQLAAHDIDLVVLAGYIRLVPAGVIAAYRGKILNVHPALLPAFGGRGMYGRRVHEAVLASGARESGPTVHLVDEEYDRGAILAQARVPVREGDTPETLAARVLVEEHRLLAAVVRAAARAGHPVPLDLAPSST